MVVLSNKKFLALLAAMVVACSFIGAVDAGHLRREDKEQKRKLSKSDKSGQSGQSGQSVQQYYFESSFLRPGINPPLVVDPVADPVDTSGFGEMCPNQKNALDSCVRTSGGSEEDKDICHLCIRGVASISGESNKALRACANPSIGGYCKGCYDEVIAFYECGSGTTVGGSPVTTPAGDGTPSTGGTMGEGGGDVITTEEANPNAVGTSYQLNEIVDYGPITSCPFDEPASGTECEITGNFRYLECPFVNRRCTCRFDTTTWMCYDLN